MTSFEKAQKIRAIVGLEPLDRYYFVQRELELIANYLEISKKGLIQQHRWVDKRSVKIGSVGSADMGILLDLVLQQKDTLEARKKAQAASQEFHGQEEFNVVDVGLTEETTLSSIFNMLPKAMTEEATELIITKDINEETNFWTVRIRFQRK